MRTTVAFDDDLFERVQELARKRKTSFRAMVNEVLRRGLTAPEPKQSASARYRVPVFRSPFRPGVDPSRLNELLDDLMVSDVTERRSG